MIDDDARHSVDGSHPNTRPCDACGHIWFAGERRHEYVDHGAGHHKAARVLCVLCLRQRRLTRAQQ